MAGVADRPHPVCRHCGHLRVSHATGLDGRELGRCIKLVYTLSDLPDPITRNRVRTCDCPGFVSIDDPRTTTIGPEAQ